MYGSNFIFMPPVCAQLKPCTKTREPHLERIFGILRTKRNHTDLNHTFQPYSRSRQVLLLSSKDFVLEQYGRANRLCGHCRKDGQGVRVLS